MSNDKLCPCFPGACRGGEVVNGFTVIGDQCKVYRDEQLHTGGVTQITNKYFNLVNGEIILKVSPKVDALFPSFQEMRRNFEQRRAKAPFEVLAFNPSTAHIDHSGATVPAPIPVAEVVTPRVTWDQMRDAAYDHKRRFGHPAIRELLDQFGVKKLNDIERDDELINRVAAAVHFDMLFKTPPEQPSCPKM